MEQAKSDWLGPRRPAGEEGPSRDAAGLPDFRLWGETAQRTAATALDSMRTMLEFQRQLTDLTMTALRQQQDAWLAAWRGLAAEAPPSAEPLAAFTRAGVDGLGQAWAAAWRAFEPKGGTGGKSEG